MRLSHLFVVFACVPLFVLAHGDHGVKDKSECGQVEESVYVYDMSLHVASIFIVFVASIVGSLCPVLSARVSCLQDNRTALDMLTSFGYGVVIATAFVHMLPHATTNLNSPCIGSDYNGLAMVICLATMYLMQLLETELVVFLGKQQDRHEKDEALSPQIELVAPHHHHGAALSNVSTRKKVTVVMFELGVAVHSVIVGIELGVSTGTDFVPLLWAIVFHQFFEGIAVGASAMTAFTDLKTLVWTSLGFSVTTPIGIAIGIFISTTYSATSTTALWIQGTFDAMAGGILIYTGVVELMTYQFTANEDFHNKRGARRALNYSFLYLGSAAMSIMGLWA
ncbi:Aste57867_8449 [Aphanomyces stellatus]|uniref:Aste57867_8449 protein n=1 Tax=Aphanomyces stellatus TaxID=120398 RepID=A0A485KK96_9STRA|nr:hypothetical protein As57867_008417 [Aphanomyces stellatus]VFT85335.1 Aste57867_8449 [Aphanomyces stellatus]